MGNCPPAGECGSIRCPLADGQSEYGSKTAGMHLSQPMNIERVLGGLLFSFRYILSYNRLGIRFIIAAISFQRFVTYAIFFFFLIAS